MVRRTKAEAEATREALLDAAIDAFLERGVSRTSLEQIAQRAGVTRGAVYWHFKDKNDLFTALIERVRLPMAEVVESLRTVRHDDPLAMLEEVAWHALRTLAECDMYRRICAIIFTRCEFVPEINPTVDRQSQLDAESLAEVTKDFERAARHGLLREGVVPRVAALALFAQIRGIYLSWLQNPELFELGREGRAMLDLYFSGLRAPAAGGAR